MTTTNANNAGVDSASAGPLPSTTIVLAILDNPATPGPTNSGQQTTGGILAATSIQPPQYNSYSYYLPAESSSTAPALATSSSSSSSSSSTKLAVGVTIPLVLLALVIGIFFFFRRRRRKVQQEKKASQYELGFSPTPTHTTFLEKSQINPRSNSSAATLDKNRQQSLATLGSRSNSRMTNQRNNGIDDPLFSPVSMEFDVASQADSHHSGSVLDSKSPNRNVSLSSHPSFTNSSLRVPGSRPSHIAELASPVDKYGPFHPENDAIHELGPGKEAEAEAEANSPGLGLEPVVHDVAELPDTSRWGGQEGDQKRPLPPSEQPAARQTGNTAREAPTALQEEHGVAATELPATVPASRPPIRQEEREGEEGRLAPPPKADDAVTSWLSSIPNTPTSQRSQ